MGGLGNQLFQIFTCISLSISSQTSFEFNITEKPLGGTIRNSYWITFFRALYKSFINLPVVKKRINEEIEADKNNPNIIESMKLKQSMIDDKGYIQNEFFSVKNVKYFKTIIKFKKLFTGFN